MPSGGIFFFEDVDTPVKHPWREVARRLQRLALENANDNNVEINAVEARHLVKITAKAAVRPPTVGIYHDNSTVPKDKITVRLQNAERRGFTTVHLGAYRFNTVSTAQR